MSFTTLNKILGPAFRFGAKVLCVTLVLPVLYFLEPFYRLRLGLVYTQRIGHLAANTDAFLRRQQLNGVPARTRYIFFGHDPANRQLFKMFQRHLNISDNRWGARLLSAWLPILKHTRFWEPFDWRTERFFLMNNSKATLTFTDEEEEFGKACLREMGIGENDWFICFHSRDGSYLRSWRPHLNEVWNTTDFKNSSIENYLAAAEHITSLGGFAVRMGAFVEGPLLETGNPKIIDYATRFRSDFLDIYLPAKCRFFLGSSSGLNMISMIFDVPLAVANHFPHTHAYYHDYDLFILRLIRHTETGEIVDFPEAAKAGFYARAFGNSLPDKPYDFEWQENNSDDILDLCQDMISALEGNTPTADARRMQDTYADTYLTHHPDYKFAAKIGPRFLLKYRDLVLSHEGPTSSSAAGSEMAAPRSQESKN